MFGYGEDAERQAYLELAEWWSIIVEFVHNAHRQASLRSQADQCLIRVIYAAHSAGPGQLTRDQVNDLLKLAQMADEYAKYAFKVEVQLHDKAVASLEAIREMQQAQEHRHRTLGRVALTGLIKIQNLSDDEPQGDSGSPERGGSSNPEHGGGSPEVRG